LAIQILKQPVPCSQDPNPEPDEFSACPSILFIEDPHLSYTAFHA